MGLPGSLIKRSTEKNKLLLPENYLFRHRRLPLLLLHRPLTSLV